MKIRFEWTIPNMLSILRLLLVPVFSVLYLLSESRPELLYWAIGVLVVSGLSDAVDGYIARRFNQISESGKLLDPAADKLTQVAVLVCLTVRYHQMIPLLIICVAKELLQLIGGAIILKSGSATMEGSHWYGKLATFVFYGVMAAFLFFENMPTWLEATLILLVEGLMINAFINYLHLFVKLRREAKATAVQSDNGTEVL